MVDDSNASKAVPLIRAASLTKYDDLARDLGLDPMKMLARVGLPQTCLRLPDSLISYVAMVDLLEYTAQMSACTDVGIRLAKRQGLSILGPVAALIRGASNAAEALALASRYLFVHSRALRFSLVPVEAQPSLVDLCIALTLPERSHAMQAQTVELSLSIMGDSIEQLAQGTFKPCLVTFPHARISAVDHYERVFACNVVFDAQVAAMRFQAEGLSYQLPNHEPLMKSLIQRYLEQYFDDAPASVADQVRVMLRGVIGAGDCSKPAIARMLGLHPRTLQRHLAQAGMAFEDVLDQVRQTMLVQYLSLHEHLPLSQIALMLGYGEQSVLTRSTHRWFGCNPRALRQRLKAGLTPPPDL